MGCPKGKFSGGKCSVGTQVQTIIFPKSAGWTSDKARSWLKSHSMSSGLDATDDSFRARQKDPGSFDSNSFRTIAFGSKSEVARQWLEDHHMNTRQFTIRESAPPGLVPFRARILAAVPGKSLNGRIYTRELLKQIAPLYVSRGVNPRPFILDHDIEHCERVVGMVTGASYGVQEAMDGRPVEGLWLEALGYMDEQLFAKMAGSKTIPGFLRGVSIGGEGEGEFTGDGVLIRKFMPAEISTTAFPGIPIAHVADINRLREHYLNHSDEKVKQTSTVQIQEREVSLEEAEKQKQNDAKNPRKIREGPLPGPDKGVNDARPGLPRPTVRSTVTHQVPQATTSSTGQGFMVDPESSFSASPNYTTKNPAYAKTGYSTTKTPGPGKLSPSGTGLTEQEAAPGTAGSAGGLGSKDAKTFKAKIPKTGATTTTHPGPGKLTPSGTGMDSEDEEEEESAAGSKDDDNPHPRKMDKTMTKNPSMAKPGENPHDKNADEEEEEERHRIRQDRGDTDDKDDSDEEEEEEEEGPEEEEESHKTRREHGPSSHIPGNPVGKKGPHAAANAYDSPADSSSEEEEESRAREDDPTMGVTRPMKPGTYGGAGEEEEEEEEDSDDGVTTDPVRKVAGQGQNIHANPTKEESNQKVLYSEADAIQASAPSLPLNPGFRATLAAMAKFAGVAKTKEAASKATIEEAIKVLTRPNDTSPEEVAKMLEAWNRGKIPKPKKEEMKIWAMGKPQIAGAKDLSIPTARKPAIDESIVKTKSVTAMSPTFSGASGPVIGEDEIKKIWDEESKKPWSNMSYLPVAKRVYNRIIMRQLGGR